MSDTPGALYYSGPFDCLECGKHVTVGNRTESPWHVVNEGMDPPQWDFCGTDCMSRYLARWHAEHPKE